MTFELMIRAVAACGVLLFLRSQEGLSDLDSTDPKVARHAFEAAVRRGEEPALVDAAARSERARAALAEIRAHRRFGATYPPIDPVTFDAADRPTSEVLADLGKRLGLRF